MPDPAMDLRVEVLNTSDIVTACEHGRELAVSLGFAGADVTLIGAALTEVARNMIEHAGSGEVLLSVIHRDTIRGLQVIAQDHGPGIPNIAEAMKYGYSTRHGLGVGLPGAKSLMDEFEIRSEVGAGTTITMRKWMKQDTRFRDGSVGGHTTALFANVEPIERGDILTFASDGIDRNSLQLGQPS